MSTKLRQRVGALAPVTFTEKKPCLLCRWWQRDASKLIQHAKAHGLDIIDADGPVLSPPAAKDLPTRKPLRIPVKDFGLCLRNSSECEVSHCIATCEHWQLAATRRELAMKLANPQKL
jgi:hypothetical protein